MQVLLVFLLLTGLYGCSGVQAPMQAIEPHAEMPRGTLAVIGGSYRSGDVFLAQAVTERLRGSRQFIVLPQQDIAKRIKEYSQLIEMRDSGEMADGGDRALWFSDAGKARLDAIQTQLGVDYVLVLWVPKITRETPITLHGGEFYHVYPVGNLVQYPSGKVIAASRLHEGESLVWITTRNKTSGDRVETLLEAAAEKIAASLNELGNRGR